MLTIYTGGHSCLNFSFLWSTAAVISVFIMGHPVIKNWGDYSTFDIPTVAEYLLE